MAVLLFLWSVCLGLAVAQTDVTRCPTNLKRGPELQSLGHHCYQFVIHHHQDWNHANNDCHSKGGALISIHSIKEQNFVMSHLGALGFAGNGVWLGLTDSNVEGSFVWSDRDIMTGATCGAGDAHSSGTPDLTSGFCEDSPVDYSYWASGQPGTFSLVASQEDCVLLKYLDSGHWHDYSCAAILFLPENYGWICEFHMQPATTTVRSTSEGRLAEVFHPLE